MSKRIRPAAGIAVLRRDAGNDLKGKIAAIEHQGALPSRSDRGAIYAESEKLAESMNGVYLDHSSATCGPRTIRNGKPSRLATFGVCLSLPPVVRQLQIILHGGLFQSGR